MIHRFRNRDKGGLAGLQPPSPKAFFFSNPSWEVLTFSLNILSQKSEHSWSLKGERLCLKALELNAEKENHNCYRKRSGNDHIINLAKMSESRNSICAARPIIESRFLPWVDASKLTSQRMKTPRCMELARIWSKQAFNISRNSLPFFEVSREAAWHDSILAEW